ncbi:Gfo/Idh/MocA family protein [Nocardiopsis sp. NPDC006938]|uniref:Gfo/Idh/MocA family protein n=1 Tax=Nocardiopsis sp. NPDC006938 TaxID=3364337 RepID=UPI003673908C
MHQSPDPRPLVLGAIGCSDIAWRKTLPTVTASPLARLACVAARDVRRAEAYADRFGCDAVADYTAVLEREDVDAVYVSLPPGLHATWVEAALRAGKHVLVEKPFAVDGATGHALMALADDLGLVLMENYAFTLHGQHARIRERVRSGEIGRLRSFEAAFTIPPRRPDDIRYRHDLAGGSLLDNGVYPLRAAIHFLGEDLRVVGAVLREDPDLRVVVSGGVLLVTADGVPAHLTFGMENAYRAEYRLSGSLGSLSLERPFTPPPDHACVLRAQAGNTEESVEMAPQDQFDALLTAFADAVADGAAPASATSASLALVDLLDQVRDGAVRVSAH